MATLLNLTRVYTTTIGQGTLVLGGTVPGFLPFLARVPDGSTVSYGIVDLNGAAREDGRGVYSQSAQTLTRGVLDSTNSGQPLNLSGAAQVFITVLEQDIPAGVTGPTGATGATGSTGAASTDLADLPDGPVLRSPDLPVRHRTRPVLAA